MLRVVGADEIGDLDKSIVKEVLARAFSGLLSGSSVQPRQTVTELPGNAGDAIFYPGALVDLGVIGVKVSPYLSSLARAGLPPVTAYTLLLSVETGEPVLICDSLGLTTIRTAATTALAIDHLAPASSRNLTIFGAGKAAQEHLSYALHARPWDSITVYARSLSGGDYEAGERRDQLTERFGPLRFADSSDEAASDADVILLCTSSGTPVVGDASVLRAKLVTSISTNVPGAHEINPKLLRELDVYCDYRATAPTTAGDFLLASQQSGWDPIEIVGDLAELSTGIVAPPDSERPRYFRSTGLGIEDLAIASLL